MDIRYNNTTILTINVEGKETRELMAPCFVEFSFNSSTLYSLKAGYYIDVYSKRYWLRYDYKPKKDPLTGGYVYSLRFDSLEALLEDYICFFITPTTKEVNWNLTGTLTQAGQIIASNLAAVGLGIYTVEGSNDVATISGNSSSIASVIEDISNKWGVEWWFEGSVLKFGECKSVASVDFVVGGVISDYQVEESMDSDFATRLYAFGSTKNITSDYRGTGTVMGMVERRLRMPVATGDFLDIAGATRIVEKVKIYEEHYPHRVGTISEAFKVGNFWRFKDDSSPFNPITEILRKGDGTDGNKISVIFESGSLMGREFELLFFTDGSEYVYEVVEKKEGENIDLSVPNNTLHPEVGDTYSLYGMVMPEAFIIAEEVALQNKAQADLIRMYSDKVNYNCPSNPVYCRSNDKKYYLGQSVNLTRHDGTIHATRIRKVERDLYDPYSAVYTLGNKPRYSMYKDIKGKIEKPLTLKQIQTSITTIISDGVITESEKKTLELILKQLSTEFNGVDATFDVVYSNEYLTTEIKADLQSKFNSYSEKYTALVNAINTGIADKFISVAESEAINAGFTNYSNAIGLLNTSLESAKKSITDAIGTTLESWVADGVISPLEKLAIKQTRAQVLSEKESLIADAGVYDISTTAYVTAWTAYDTALAKYSAEEPEIITVDTDFATSESAYKTAKVALKTAITNAQKSDTGEKHPKGGSADLDMTVKNLVAVGYVGFYGGVSGGSPPASSLLDLSDIDATTASAVVGSPLVKLSNGKWGPGSVSIDLTNYFTKAESDARFAFKSHSHDYVTPTAFNAHTADSVKHITSAERSAWNAKEQSLGNPDVSGKILASTTSGVRSWVSRYVLPVATAAVLGGVMIGANISVNAQGVISVAAPYSHPATHPASMITESTTRRFITDTERANWNDSYDKRHTHGNKANLDSINQNLSQTSNVKFNDIVADGSIGFYGGVGSGSTPVASLLDLSDIDASISTAATGTPLVKLATGKWGAGSVSIDLSNYYNKSDADARYAFKSHSHDYVAPSAFNAHTGSTSNPHSVTAAQVGLGNVLNVASYSKPETYSKTEINNFSYKDIRTITPQTYGVRTLQFGFTSMDLANGSPYADFMRFGGYGDASGGRKNIILFSKNDFGIRQYQGDFSATAYNHGFVDYWHSANLLNIGTTASSARTALGLGTMATETASNYSLTSHNHDGRYVFEQNAINSDATKTFPTGKGITLGNHTDGSTGFPNPIGSYVDFSTYGGSSATAWRRDFTLWKQADVLRWYLRGYSNVDGSPLSWNEIWHSGNSNRTTVDWSAKNLTLAGSITGATTVVASSYIQGAYYKLGNWEIKQNASGELEFILSGSLKFKITSTGIVSSGGVAFYS